MTAVLGPAEPGGRPPELRRSKTLGSPVEFRRPGCLAECHGQVGSISDADFGRMPRLRRPTCNSESVSESPPESRARAIARRTLARLWPIT